MSYDIRIWSIKRAEIPESLPSPNDWKMQNESAYYAKKDWQIVVSEPAKVEDEDIADEVSSLLPGIKYVTDVTLEPIHAPAVAKAILDKVAKSIAKNNVGVIENPQEDTFSLPSGIKKFTPAKRENKERFSIIEMSWWFNDNSQIENLLKQIVDYFERKLPEALPKKYGLYEPPQFKYEEIGKQKFLEFLNEHIFDLGIVWYPTKPVMSVSTSGFVEQWGFRKHGGENRFKTNEFSISFDSSVLNQPGWKEHLSSVFKDISKILQPFYGEVRTLHNFISGKATYFSDMETEDHPVQGPWWTGIPQKLGQSIVVGEPYLTLWPQVKERGEVLGGLYFVSTGDWTKEEKVNSIIGNPPKEIAQLKKPKWIEAFGRDKTMDYDDDEEYPKVFPFQKQI